MKDMVEGDSIADCIALKDVLAPALKPGKYESTLVLQSSEDGCSSIVTPWHVILIAFTMIVSV